MSGPSKTFFHVLNPFLSLEWCQLDSYYTAYADIFRGFVHGGKEPHGPRNLYNVKQNAYAPRSEDVKIIF